MTLNEIMEFDHVVRVDEFGNVTDGNDGTRATWAPSLYDGELDTDGWTLMDGYSGQCGYSGPMMHASEFVGGQLERDILATPGLYVVLVNYELDGSEPTEWAVAYHEPI